MVRVGLFVPRSIFIMAAAISLGQASLVQCQQKAEDAQLRYATCPVHDCGFCIQSPDTAEIRLAFSSHMQYEHNQKLDAAQIQSLTQVGRYVPEGVTVLTVACPFGDSFALWSRDEKELQLWLQPHAQLIHGKELSGAAIKQLVKPSAGK